MLQFMGLQRVGPYRATEHAHTQTQTHKHIHIYRLLSQKLNIGFRPSFRDLLILVTVKTIYFRFKDILYIIYCYHKPD